jgi:glutathione S-transferase
MAKPIVYGPAYSTYARITRLALEEKGVDYDLVEVDLLAGAAKAPEHLARHPFEHDGFELYETDAIMRYVNATFPGQDLDPADAKGRARMAQAISVIGGYAYPCMLAGAPNLQRCWATVRTRESVVKTRPSLG